MLKDLHLRDVGPASKLDVEFGERLNIFTGDNSLGKTFLLDVAWWALTRTWAGEQAMPGSQRKSSGRPTIKWQVILDDKGKVQQKDATFNFRMQSWIGHRNAPEHQGLVVYARVDGGFSVWDPARNLPLGEVIDGLPVSPNRPRAYHFTPSELWNGLPGEANGIVCNGLIRDWVTWQYGSRSRDLKEKPPFEALRRVVGKLSHDPGGEPVAIGDPMRVSVENAIDIPTVVLPYGTVPITHASAGIKRVAGLAYLLVWAWHEHCLAARLRNQKPAVQLVLLVDEIEAHLHPRWQRTIVPALVEVAQALEMDAQVQPIVTTHAPLVLASIEPLFDEERDRLFSFELRDRKVSLDEVPWSKQGDVVNWLASEAFGLRQARSKEAEAAIDAAESFMQGDMRDRRQQQRIHKELCGVLAGNDPFWARWVVKTEASTP